jgi:hypothetical protein
MKNWIIVDWMSNRCFTNHSFKSYEDAWDFLYETFPNEDQEDELGEYYVIKISTKHFEKVGGFKFLRGA